MTLLIYRNPIPAALAAAGIFFYRPPLTPWKYIAGFLHRAMLAANNSGEFETLYPAGVHTGAGGPIAYSRLIPQLLHEAMAAQRLPDAEGADEGGGGPAAAGARYPVAAGTAVATGTTAHSP